MKIELDVQIPDGYEATGEYRKPMLDEYLLNGCGFPDRQSYDGKYASHFIILRKKEPPKPQYRPWKAHEVPLDAWFRPKSEDTHQVKGYAARITGINDGSVWLNVAPVGIERLLDHWEWTSSCVPCQQYTQWSQCGQKLLADGTDDDIPF